MKTKLPYGDWLNLMADTVGLPRDEFVALKPDDRKDLLVAASGVSKGAFFSMDAYAQAQAIKKHLGEGFVVPVQNEALDGEKAEGQGQGEGQGEEDAPEEGEAEAEAEAESETPDPTVTLKGLEGFLGPYVEAKVKAAVDKAKAEMGGGGQRLEIKLPEGKVTKIDGHVHPKFQDVLTLAMLGLPIMLVGPAGTGKTTLGRQVAKALDRKFGSVSCTAGMSEGELVGKLLPGENGGFHYRASQFVTLYEGGGVFLVDELDAADPNVLLKVNQSIGSVQGDGLWHNDLRHSSPEVRQHKDFVLVAAANTFGTGAGAQYVGRNQLDAATLDRFEVIEIDYDTEFEAAVGDPEICAWLWNVRKKATEAKLRRVVSTRAIQRATLKKGIGWNMAKIKEGFFTPWSADEKAKITA